MVNIQIGLLVLAYPDIAQSAYNWIQEIRRRHDERYFRVVEPHFTLVFPAFNVTPSKFIGHVLEHTRFIHAIDFVITHARVVEDDSRNFWHTFLVPDVGYTAITKLHDLLYSGILRQELRTDIPFIPHIGVGTNDSENAMRQLAADINATPLQIEGSVTSLTIASYADSIVTNLEQVDLRPR